MLAGFRLSAAALTVLQLVLTACGRDGPTDPPALSDRVAEVEALTSTSFTATVGTEVLPAPSVRVLDSAGNPMVGIRVTFTALDAITQHDQVVLTGEAGTAGVYWHLGGKVGQQRLRATAGTRAVVFTALTEPGPIAKLAAVNFRHQVGAPGASVTVPLRVSATDRFGNPIGGVEVTFEVEGGGVIAAPSAVSGADGRASAGEWTLGPALGWQQVIARAAGRQYIFTAEACVESCPELVFVRKGDIYVFEFATQSERRLTWNGSNRDPAWSPDGRRIAFAHQESTSGVEVVDIYIMDADGTNLVRRTAGRRFHSPSWSPDGSFLAVAGVSRLCEDGCDIWILEVASDEEPRHFAAMAADPAWSPDGTQIAYVRLSGDDGYHALHIASVEGTHTAEVVPVDAHSIAGPAWSPDGKQIAFTRCSGARCLVATVSPDGSAIILLTLHHSDPHQTYPAWSRDGRLIAYEERWAWENTNAVFYIPAAGGTPELLVGEWAHSPAWRP